MPMFDPYAVLVTALNTLLLVAVLAGVILLEVWLSRRKSRWPGLILPVLSFLLSLLIVVGNFAFLPQSSTIRGAQVVDEVTGETVYQAQQVQGARDWTMGDTVQLGMVLLVSNIPTIVLLGAHYVGREKLRREKLLAKMNIQDL